MLSTANPARSGEGAQSVLVGRGAYLQSSPWLSLSTSSQLHIRAGVCQNDAMAYGRKRSLPASLPKAARASLNIPFTWLRLSHEELVSNGIEADSCGRR